MKQGMNLNEMAAQVQHSADHKQDYVVPISNIDFGRSSTGEFEYFAGVKDHGGIGGQMNRHALNQMATVMEIPAKFVNTLIAEDPDYLPELLNRRAFKSDGKRMLRTIENRMVGAVSPSFSRDYDNDVIMKALLPAITEKGLEVTSCNLSETKMHLKVLSPRLKGEVTVGDVIQGGISAGNSDVGLSRAFINRLAYRLWCLNGCTHTESVNAYSRIHRGSKQPEGILYRQETVASFQNALAMEMADTVTHLLSEESFNGTIEQMRAITENKLSAKNLDASVKELGKIVGYSQSEGDDILAHLIEGGDLSQYGMLQAVTRYSQDVNSYDRATDFELMGGKILELNPRSWNTVVEAQQEAA
jgi:hypothetical protein